MSRACTSESTRGFVPGATARYLIKRSAISVAAHSRAWYVAMNRTFGRCGLSSFGPIFTASIGRP